MFEDNYVKLNTDKCHLLISGHIYKYQWAQIVKDMFWEKKEVKVLGTTIDNELNFDSHISNVCLKTNNKLRILCSVKNF